MIAISCEGDDNHNIQNYSEIILCQLYATLLIDLWSLNLKQRQMFDFIYNWAKLVTCQS